MLPFVLQYGTACSPLVAATNLGAELAEINAENGMTMDRFDMSDFSSIAHPGMEPEAQEERAMGAEDES